MPNFKRAKIVTETCPYGHPRTPENLVPGSYMMCRACLQERALIRRLQKRTIKRKGQGQQP